MRKPASRPPSGHDLRPGDVRGVAPVRNATTGRDLLGVPSRRSGSVRCKPAGDPLVEAFGHGRVITPGHTALTRMPSAEFHARTAQRQDRALVAQYAERYLKPTIPSIERC